jgi:hypothetical protein
MTTVRRAHGLRRAALLALAAVILAGCDLPRMNFVRDDRLEITSPADRSVADFPVTVSWSVDGFDIASPGDEPRDGSGYFAVFLNRSPIGPSESIFDIGEEDPACRADPACPDETYLNQRDVYPAWSTEVVLDAFSVLGADQQYHTVWVVLLDSSGRRIGESQWRVNFDVRLPGEVES